MPSRHRAESRTTSSHHAREPSAGRSNNVHISRPLQFGSQQQIRGPNDVKSLDKLRHEQGNEYDPLQVKRERRQSSLSRVWGALKRSLSRTRNTDTVSNEQAFRRPASQRRSTRETMQNFAQLLAKAPSRSNHQARSGVTMPEEEDRGRRRRRRGETLDDSHHPRHARDRDQRASNLKYDPADAKSSRYNPSSRSRARHSTQNAQFGRPVTQWPSGDPGASASASKSKSKRRNTNDSSDHPDHPSNFYEHADPRKAFGPPYDRDITSEWSWDWRAGEWYFDPDNPARVKYENLSDDYYSQLTCRRRGIFPAKPRTKDKGKGKEREREREHRSGNGLDKQLYFDENTQTYRELTVRDAARQHKESASGAKHKSYRAQVQSVDDEDDEEPVVSKSSHHLRSSHKAKEREHGEHRHRNRERRGAVAEAPVIKIARPTSSIYPDDEDDIPETSNQPAVPGIPSKYGAEYQRQQTSNLRDSLASMSLQPKEPQAKTRTSAASPVNSPPAARSYQLVNDNPYLPPRAGWPTFVQTNVAQARPQAPPIPSHPNIAAESIWQTDTRLYDLTDMPRVDIPGLEPIRQSTQAQDLQRLANKKGITPEQREMLQRQVNGGGGQQQVPVVARSGTQRRRAADTVCGIIDAYGDEGEAMLQTRWDDD